jgi:4-amino-4-deoxy-L-arabinose transferase-like glycosyltransferase
MKGQALPRRWEIAGILLITLLAAALRFYRLPELPPGLHFDEGFKGVTARALLEGAPPKLFFESDMGEEPIAIYLVAAALWLFGQAPWIIRLPSAVVGTLTVPLAWWLGRELFRTQLGSAARRSIDQELRGQVAGLGAALILAILYWHLSFSRIGMEPILVPFFATLAFAALARGLNLQDAGQQPHAMFVVAGLALGGSLYTYKAGYFVPILAALFVAYAAVAERGFLRRHGRGLLVVALVALIVTAPIGVYFASHPANFLQRPASVAVVGGENTPANFGQALLDNLPRVLGMFFVRGDANPRSNLPGRPALDPFLALLFLIGLARALFGLRRPLTALSLLWLGVMVLPTLVTEHAPHFGRAIGATPAMATLCALGGWTLWETGNREPGTRGIGIWRLVIALVLAAGLAFSGISTMWAYFHTWGQSADLFYAYDVGLVQVADFVNGTPQSEDVYLTPTSRDHYTLQYLVHRPLSSFDGRAGLVFPPPGRAASVIVLLGEDQVTVPALQQARPDAEVTWTLDDEYGRPYAVAYHLPASDSPAPLPEHTTDAVFAGQIRLLGYDLQRITDHELRITLYWQALSPLTEDYTVFTHLLGEHNPATGGPLWAGHDSQPDGGHYPTTTWQPGQVALDMHTLSLPADAPPGEYRLEAGLYLLATMRRLPAIDAAGQRLADDAVQLGTVGIGK